MLQWMAQEIFKVVTIGGDEGWSEKKEDKEKSKKTMTKRQ